VEQNIDRPGQPSGGIADWCRKWKKADTAVPSRRWLELGGVVSGVRNPDSGVGAPVETTP